MSGFRRVGINAVFLQPRMGGLDTYTQALVPELLALRPDLDLSVFCNRIGAQYLRESAPWAGDVRLVTHPLLGIRGLRAASELTLLGALASRRVDVLHSVALTAPLRTRAANVVTIADVTWIVEPDPNEAFTVKLWQTVVPPVARRADRVITISQAAADHVVEHLGVRRDRLDVVLLGHAGAPRAQPTPERPLREKLGLGEGPLVLTVSAKKRHKNLLGLVRAMAEVVRAVPGAQLVMPGNPSPHEDELRALAAELGIPDAIALPGWIDTADLEGLYAAATAFTIASTNEGFGLPLLDAMARDVPIACSDVSALPEVAGEAALLFDPHDPTSIATALTTLLRDEGERERLVALGRRRQGEFTWRRAAEGTLDSYERAWAARTAS